jgi:hypothetical protein
MQRAPYLLCFTLVAVSTLGLFTLWVIQHTGGSVPPGMQNTATVFGHPVPDIAKRALPAPVNIVLFLGQVVLIVRRLFLMLRERSANPPASYAGVVIVLLKVAAVSVGLGLLVLLASIALGAGSGVLAGLVFLPAALLLPYVPLWVELASLRRPAT